MDEFLKYLVAGLIIIGIALVIVGTDWSAYEIQTQTKTVQVQAAASDVPAYEPKTVMEKTTSTEVGFLDEEIVESHVFEFDTRYLRDDSQYYIRSANLYSGLINGNNDLSYEFEYPVDVHIEFSVKSTNHIAPLMITVNDRVVSSKFYTVGDYSLDIPKGMLEKKSRITIMTASSSWKLWAPSIYNLTDIRIMEKSFAEKPAEYTFYFNQENFQSARLELQFTKNTGEAIIELNGNILHDGSLQDEVSLAMPKEYLAKENVITIRPKKNSEFSGFLKTLVFYRKRANENTFAVAFDISGESYEHLKSGQGKLEFYMERIKYNGIVHIRMGVGDTVLLDKYEPTANGKHVIYIDSKNVVAGGNKLIISAAENALFTISDARIIV